MRSRFFAVFVAPALLLGACTAPEIEARLDSLFDQPSAQGAGPGAVQPPAEPAADAERLYREALRAARGEGVPRDERRGAELLQQAADRGHGEAQTVIAAAHAADGRADQAARWYALAAEQGQPEAQYRLAEAWLNGTGVPRDEAYAALWYAKAAQAGQREAQFMLGSLLVAGRGVGADREAAYVWFVLAGKAGHAKAAEFRDKLGAQLGSARGRLDAAARRFAPRRLAGYDDRPSVRYAQGALERLGYEPGPADGVTGPRTRAALANYRKMKGLGGGGGLDGATMRALQADSGAR